MNPLPSVVPAESALFGVAASYGIAIGLAFVIDHRTGHLPRYKLTSLQMVDEELARINEAREVARTELIAAREALPPELQSQSGILDAYLLLLDDPILTHNNKIVITQQKLNAEQAIVKTMDLISQMLSKVNDAYIGSRMADVKMVGQAILSALRGEPVGDVADCPEGAIVVTKDISPARLIKLASSKISGLLTENGSRTSHASIIAQAMELPAVVGAKNLAAAGINTGDVIIIDGQAGHVIVRPNEEVLKFYRSRQEMENIFKAEIVRCAHLPAITLDDYRIDILGNLEMVDELPAILSYGGEGIGLYRTEFLYLTSPKTPSEDELFDIYKQVVETASPKPVTIRTLDLGYDKMVENNETSELDSGIYAQALGLRGIRYSLKKPDIFKTQLRAILRASAYGELRIMLPMLSELEELRASRAILEEISESLRREGVPQADNIPLGVMIEVPATIFLAKDLAAEADFFSIGTNDLIQYTLAVDRGNPEVAEMYQPLHPAILKMLEILLSLGHDCNIPVSVCGDMAADIVTAPILIGLGASILSMPPPMIPKIKRLVRMSSMDEMKNWAETVMACKTAREAAQTATKLVKDKFPELFN